MDNISYDVYYAVRDTYGRFTLYDTPSKTIKGECIQMIDDKDVTNVKTKKMTSFNIGIHQLIHLLASNPGIMNTIDSRAPPLHNVGYKGTDECPRERMIDRFDHPLLTKNTSFGTSQLKNFTDIPEYIQENHTFPLSNYVVVDTHIQPAGLEQTIRPPDIYNISKSEFYKNIEVNDTELELVGYLLYIAGHYTTNVKRNGKWWAVTDLGDTYDDMVSSDKELSYRDAVFSENGQWNPETMLPQSYPVVLVYKNVRKSWGVKFIEDKPSVTRNPGTACYILSPSVLYANLPELVLSVLGKTEANKYITNDESLRVSDDDEDNEEVVATTLTTIDTPTDTKSQKGVGRHTHRRKRFTNNRVTKKNKRVAY